MSVAARRLASIAAGGALIAGVVVAPPPVAAATGASIVVNALTGSSANDGLCTLQEALLSAENDSASGAKDGECAAGSPTGTDTITFSVSGTIYADAWLPNLVGNIDIDGGGHIVLDFRPQWRPFTVLGGGVIGLEGLDLRGSANGTTGGAISNAGTLTVTDTIIRNSMPGGSGGAIENTGTLVLNRATIRDNIAPAAGAIHATGPVTITDSVFENNTSWTGGGALDVVGAALTVSNTRFSQNAGVGGGAIRSTGATTITDCTFVDNRSSTAGGAVYATGALTVSGGTFSRNSAATNGGAVAATGTATITNTTFSGNHAVGTGGAIDLSGTGSSTLTGLTVTDNASTGDGGGIHEANGTVHLVSSTVHGNTTAGLGGGVSAATSVHVDQTTVDHNTAGVAGGGLHHAGIGIEITASTISANQAPRGGGVYSLATTTSLANDTLVGNAATAADGGAVVTGAEQLIVGNTTVTGNTAATEGGGIGQANATVINSIVLGNTAPADAEMSSSNSLAYANSIFEMPAGKVLADILDPAGLGAHGGTTQTVLLTKGAGNPAIDGGDASWCAEIAANVDQRGLTRSTPCDIGSVEIDQTAPWFSGTPGLWLRSDAKLSGSSAPAHVHYFAHDDGIGLKQVTVQRSVNGGAYSTVATTSAWDQIPVIVPTTGTVTFRVKAVDFDGNSTGWVTGSPQVVRLLQQTSTTITYHGTWSTATSSLYSGGSEKFTTSKGAYATFKFTGQGFAIVTTRASSRGTIRVYVDGRLWDDVVLTGSTAYRYVAYAVMIKGGSVSHTVKIVNLGTPGKTRVDLDAIVTLR